LRPNSAKQDQANQANATKKIKKIPSSDRQAFRQTCGFYPAIWPGDLAM
jgi:hypothetical protein